MIKSFEHPIIGQEVICPDGIGRVIEFKDAFPTQWVKVKTYVNNRECKWDPSNVEMIVVGDMTMLEYSRAATETIRDVIDKWADISKAIERGLEGDVMGEYTDYALTFGKTSSYDRFLSIIKELRDASDAKYGLDRHGDSSHSIKWYNHEADMIKLSKKHPHYVFELSGESSDPIELWRKYFKNGKKQVAKVNIMFEDFSESKLV